MESAGVLLVEWPRRSPLLSPAMGPLVQQADGWDLSGRPYTCQAVVIAGYSGLLPRKSVGLRTLYSFESADRYLSV